jgi:hypothetical protein
MFDNFKFMAQNCQDKKDRLLVEGINGQAILRLFDTEYVLKRAEAFVEAIRKHLMPKDKQ